jgi:hypothetical protein
MVWHFLPVDRSFDGRERYDNGKTAKEVGSEVSQKRGSGTGLGKDSRQGL